jgi:hypothetical protein
LLLKCPPPLEGPPPPLHPPPILSPDVVAFASLIASLHKQAKHAPPKFVKKFDKIPPVQIQGSSRTLTVKFAYLSLIGQVTGIWLSLRAVAIWIDKNWKPHLKGNFSHFLYGRGFFAFLFEEKSDRDLIFRSNPYFMGSRGMYLNSLTPYFIPENGIPNVVPA